MLVRAVATLALALVGAGAAVAAPFAPGNLLIQSQTPGSSAYAITEYTQAGVVVQSFTPEQPPGQTDVFHPRDLVIDAAGRLFLYNGTFDPFLSTFDPASGSWSHVTHAGWSTVNNVSYGGIAEVGGTVFVTDMATFGEPADLEQGVVAFHTQLGTSVRFTTAHEPIDLNLGRDGNLWVLEGATAFAYDPASLAFLGSVVLHDAPSDPRALAVASGGDFYVASWDGVLAHLDATGALLASIEFPDSLTDVDLGPSGLVAVSSRFSGAWLTDTAFSFTRAIPLDRWNSFVTFVPEAGEITVAIDIRPGSGTNPVRASSRGVIAVALLGTESFAVGDVDETTLAFGPGGAPPVQPGARRDVNGDGWQDLVSHYRIPETGIAAGDLEACLAGETGEGEAFTGCDAVRTVGRSCGVGFELAFVLWPIAWRFRKARPAPTA
jgi:hypothetical protein